MISKIELNTIPFNATIQSLETLKKFNYLFGSNGAGKTSISRIIAKPKDYTNCNITWENGTPLETLVYNRDFIERNFNSTLKGVFTLGETEATTLETMENIKNDIKNINGEIERLNKTLEGEDGNGGKKKELIDLNFTYKTKFWKQKQKHDEKLGCGLTPHRGDSVNFMNKIINESINNQASLLSQAELEEKALTIFSKTLVTVNRFSTIDYKSILEFEKNPILQKRIIGKGDIDISAMIKKLNNSDWVRQGASFLKVNDGICPFCQQKTTKNFEKSLKEYFDETFTEDSTLVNKLASDYSAEATRIQQQIQGLINMQSEFIDTEKLKTYKVLFDSLLTSNLQFIKEKQKEISKSISLDSIENILSDITSLIVDANDKIDKRNDIIKNIIKEKSTLTAQIWKFITNELSADISEYKNKKNGLETAISNLSRQIQEKNICKRNKERELNELEKSLTTIIPTRDGINNLLSSFGFKSFKLEIGDDKKTYNLLRENGTDAHITLSEGERNFVTFLYFYYLLNGSQEETGLTNDKVVVFDDPISSLDNDVLFIVSSLIREIIQNVRENKGNIKQVFILTHNIYFHKEVTYNNKRGGSLLSEETFWLIKKNGCNSIAEKQTENPIKTSYELLWNEIKNGSVNKITIQNTMRRILENYFKLLGNLPLDKLYKKFDGDNKVKCKALCSWVNDGSHSAFDDDFYTIIDDEMIEKYLEVFKQIFVKTDQIAHYNMMMGIVED